MILEKLGIYGWKEKDENLILAGLLTGDPILLIGRHGAAKTHAANKIAEALGKKFIAYDASKALFEDVLGYPDIKKLQAGEVSYIPSKVTLWDKEMVLIDELNRALPEMQNKWLEVIRSRKIMGFDTNARWVWAAMNPLSYTGAQALDDALVGRFALFVYPPEVLDMNEEDRKKVTSHINGEDAPAFSEWSGKVTVRTVESETTVKAGEEIKAILRKAATYFLSLREKMTRLTEFLARYADLLARETKGEIKLDGRRLGFLYRSILANRAVELAKADLNGGKTNLLSESASYVTASGIPVGINDEGVRSEGTLHKIEICFDLLKETLEEEGSNEKIELIYELFTTGDLIRKTEILLTQNLGELAQSKAWHDMMERGDDVTTFAWAALQVEALRPGTIPQELIEALSRKIDSQRLSPECIGDLEDESIEQIEGIEALLEHENDLEKLLAIQRVKKLAGKKNIRPEDVAETERLIEHDIETFRKLIREGRK